MSNNKVVLFANKKGGVGKTTISHLLAVGCAWHNKNCAMIHTDLKRPLEIDRPYSYFDGRDDQKLIELATKIENENENSVIILDSGANRKDHDLWLCKYADVIFIPMNLSPEDIEDSIERREDFINLGHENVHYIINKMPAQSSLSADDMDLLDMLESKWIAATVPQVKASRVLTGNDKGGFKTPPTAVNNAARALYRQLDPLINNGS